jgi:DNA-binding SARP family transcriptional activator
VESLDFRLLGPMDVLADGRAVPLPNAAERALLAILVLSVGYPVAATSLIDRLWREEALPVDPMNALQTRVSKLRRSLTASGLEVVVRDGIGGRAWSGLGCISFGSAR